MVVWVMDWVIVLKIFTSLGVTIKCCPCSTTAYIRENEDELLWVCTYKVSNFYNKNYLPHMISYVCRRQNRTGSRY
jgi:hypothetical protein